MSMSVHDAVQHLAQDPGTQSALYNAYLNCSAREAFRRFRTSEEWAEIRRIVREFASSSKNVLDLGAGTGFTSLAWLELGSFVYYLEPDSSDLVGRGAFEKDLTSSERTNLHIDSCTGENISLPDASIDIVYSRQVLHHIKDLARLAKEVRRVIKPSGVWIATREHVADTPEELNEFLSNHPMHKLAQNEHAYALEEYKDALKSQFRITQILGPFDSAINFFPTKSTDITNWLFDALKKRLGTKIASILSQNKYIRTLYQKRLSSRCRIPGRMYSFILRPK